MKTTIEIPDPLLEEARKLAVEEGRSIRSLVEQGLRQLLSERKRKPFRLRKATFAGNGLQREWAGIPWEQIRDRTYEGRGG